MSSNCSGPLNLTHLSEYNYHISRFHTGWKTTEQIVWAGKSSQTDKSETNRLGPVVRRVDNFVQRINPYPADKIGAFLILIE